MTHPGHVYIVELENGLVKVGKTQHRFARLAEYARAPQDLLAWTSPAHHGYVGSERELINMLTAQGRLRSGTETFSIGFTAAVAIARGITSREAAA